MEVTIGTYGRMMFEIITGNKKDLPPHWDAIYDEAKPLVEELIKLNNKMGYRITGYRDSSGKKRRTNNERIRLAQKELWGAKIGDLKEPNEVWLYDNSDHEMHVGEQYPAPIEYVKDKYVAIEMQGQGETYILKVDKNQIVLKAPDDYYDKEMLYTSRDYWLKKADELDI